MRDSILSCACRAGPVSCCHHFPGKELLPEILETEPAGELSAYAGRINDDFYTRIVKTFNPSIF